MESHDEINKSLGEIKQWTVDHGAEDHVVHQEIFARFDIMESNMGLLPTKNDIDKVVKDALIEVLFKTGRGTKFWLVTIATVIGAIVVIGGGAKAVLGWFSLTILRQ